MTELLTVHHPCRLDLECPDGVPAPGHAASSLLKYLFSVRGKSVLDLGCGCGLLAIAAAKLGAGDVWAVDASAAAVDCTRRNAARNGVDVTAKRGDLFDPVTGRTFDLIVALPQAGAFESILREAPEFLDRGGELLVCVPSTDETPRFESLLRERFRFRQLPETRVEPILPGREVCFLRSYLAMKQ
jgi:16S rRNA G1207 methylase RsmC